MEYKILKGSEKLDERFNKDLTNSFKNIAKLRGFSNKLVNIQTPKSEFLRITTEITKKLNLTDVDLNTMKDNLKKSSVFINNDEKINDLIVKIKESLSDIQDAIAALNKNDNDFSYNSQIESLSKIILETLQVRALKSAEYFQNLLQKRAEDIHKREEKSSIYKPSMNNPSLGIMENLRNRPMFLEKDAEKEIEKEKDQEELKYKREFKKYDQSRSESIKNIEKLLHDVASTFHRLGTMVKMQEVMVDRIDKNVDDTVSMVNKGKENLMRHYEDVKSNKGIVIRVFIVLMIFSIFYIIFLL